MKKYKILGFQEYFGNIKNFCYLGIKYPLTAFCSEKTYTQKSICQFNIKKIQTPDLLFFGCYLYFIE